MPGFRLQNFKGIRPRLSSRLLPEGEGQTAENVRLESGDLEPWNEASVETSTCTSGVETIYRFRNGGTPLWFQWTTDVDVTRGPVLNDELERTYFTGDGVPKMTFTAIADGGGCLPNADRNLGIPAATTAPDLTAPTVATGGTVGPDDISATTLKMTFDMNVYPGSCTVSTWWERPSPPLLADSATEFNFFAGDRIRVTTVPDDDNFVVGPVDDADFFARGYNPVPSTGTIQTWTREDTGGCTPQSGTVSTDVTALHELNIAKTAHGLRVGDLLTVVSVAQPVIYTWTTSQKIYDAEVFGTPESGGEGGAGLFHMKKVWHDATGSTDFDVRGEFTFTVERVGSDLDAVDTRAYVYTFVSALGEEGPPSPPSSLITVVEGDSITVDNFDTTPAAPQYDITNRRIYRTSTGSSTTEFQFVAEITEAATSYVDSSLASELAEVLQTTTWDPPQTDMLGITTLPNGMMAGFTGKTVHFAEPYFPHAWPPEYEVAVDHDIVGLGVLPTGALVLTVGDPYIITGAHPRAMSLTHLEFAQSCVSKRSITNTKDTVLYASPDGLVSIGASGFNVLTSEFLEKRDWQVFNPSTMQGFLHDGRYFGFYDTGLVIISIKRESTTQTTGFNISTTPDAITAGYVDAETDTLYFLRSGNNTIDAWDGNTASPKTLTWKSAKLRGPYQLNLAAGRVVADAYPVTITFYADSKKRGEITVKDDEVFRMPGGYLADVFEFEVAADTTVSFMHFAETVKELGEG